MELSLTQLFGENATQTTDYLIIRKFDLIGLTASANNQSEQLLAAIINTAIIAFYGYVEDSKGIALTDETGEKVNYENRYEFINLFWWKPYFENAKIVHQAIIEILEIYAN